MEPCLSGLRQDRWWSELRGDMVQIDFRRTVGWGIFKKGRSMDGPASLQSRLMKVLSFRISALGRKLLKAEPTHLLIFVEVLAVGDSKDGLVARVGKGGIEELNVFWAATGRPKVDTRHA